jgi:uncharacterized membrane protein YgdD (TMEM256/DUF423 family)
MDRFWFALGALAGLGAVALSAAAAHMRLDPAATTALRDAVQMQGWHALALLVCGIKGGRWCNFAGWFFTLGLLAFCGAVYARIFWHGLPVSNVAPFGGVMLMIGWAMLFVAALRRRGR